MFSIKELRWLFASVLAAFFVTAIFIGTGSSGLLRWRSDDSYHLVDVVAPWQLILAAILLGLYFLLQHAPPDVSGERMPGLLPRLLAFWIDMLLGIMVSIPVLGVIPLLLEWIRTRRFKWGFERIEAAPGDTVMVAVYMALQTIALLAYFAVPLVRGRPTPGACIVGYKIIGDDGNPLKPRDAVLRTLLGIVAVHGGILAPFLGHDREHGKFWLDKVFNTHAVKPR